MGVLTRLVLASMLFGCAPAECDIGSPPSLDSFEKISLFKSSLEQRSRNAAVEIKSFDEAGNKISGSGAYVVYKRQHYILTAAHVVVGSPTAMIVGDKEVIIGDVVFADAYSDVALVSIAGMINKDPIKWRTSGRKNIGDEIIYSGYPNAMGLLTIKGYIAGYDSFMTVIHSYVWRGASGSLVLDEQGKIVGIISSVAIGTDVTGFPAIIEDVGLVVPVYAVEEFLKTQK